MPIAQQYTVLREVAIIRAASSIWARDNPVEVSTTSQSRARRCSAYASKPWVCCAMKSWSSSPHSSSSDAIAWNSARSPLMRTGR